MREWYELNTIKLNPKIPLTVKGLEAYTFCPLYYNKKKQYNPYLPLDTIILAKNIEYFFNRISEKDNISKEERYSIFDNKVIAQYEKHMGRKRMNNIILAINKFYAYFFEKFNNMTLIAKDIIVSYAAENGFISNDNNNLIYADMDSNLYPVFFTYDNRRYAVNNIFTYFNFIILREYFGRFKIDKYFIIDIAGEGHIYNISIFEKKFDKKEYSKHLKLLNNILYSLHNKKDYPNIFNCKRCSLKNECEYGRI